MSAQSPASSPSGIWTGAAHSKSPRNESRSPGQRNNDPPRPAKDGFEWVWFPEGYWAERPLDDRRSSKQNSQRSSQSQTSPVGKIFRWSSRQSRSPQEISDTQEIEPFAERRPIHSISPLSQPRPSQLMPPKSLPQSPYLSESAQIAALQHPYVLGGKRRGSRDTWTSSSPASAPIDELSSPEIGQMTEQNVPKHNWKPFRRRMVRIRFQEGHQFLI